MYRICNYDSNGIRVYVQCPCGDEVELVRYIGSHNRIEIHQHEKIEDLCVIIICPFVNPTFAINANEFRVIGRLRRYVTDKTDGKFVRVVEDDVTKRVPGLLPES